jgi:hypothetical protein
MDDEKRKNVVKMLADAQKEAGRASKGKTSKDRSTAKAPSSRGKKGRAEVVYIQLESHDGLADALNAIAQIKREK